MVLAETAEMGKTTVTDLRPGQSVIEIVFHLVVFWETEQVTVLHVHEVLRLQRKKETVSDK